MALLQKYRDVFAWTYDEMPGLDLGLVVHSINVDPGVRSVVQLARVFHTEVEAQIIQEVKKPLTGCFIKPIQHPVEGHLWKAQWKEKPSDKGHRKLTMNS